MSCNPILNSLCVHMRNYQLPSGRVHMPVFDTGGVVGVLLHFIERENKISRSKLEYQMLLLEVLNEYSGNGLLFDWTFDNKNGRPNLENFLSFIEERGLVIVKNHQYVIVKHDVILDRYFDSTLLVFIDRVSDFLIRFNSSQAADAVKQVIRVIKNSKNGDLYIKKNRVSKSSKYDSVVSQCLRIIENRTPKSDSY